MSEQEFNPCGRKYDSEDLPDILRPRCESHGWLCPHCLRIAEVEAHLTTALSHAEEFVDGCLYCGEGEIVDGECLPHDCWYEKAERALEATDEQA